MNKIVVIIGLLSFMCFGNIQGQTSETKSAKGSSNTGKVEVLNVGTFHMGSTSDANTIEFDINNKDNQDSAHKIAERIAQFKPSIICVEVTKEKEEEMNKAYQQYLLDPSKASIYGGEIGLIAFEVARLCNVSQLVGIDYEMSYNYNIGSEITNSIDSSTIKKFYANPFASIPEFYVDPNSLSLLEKLQINNAPKYLDFLMLVNADLLAFIGTEGAYEGADEAAKYYQRNLRIYSNLNRIPTTKDDRIFILSGGSHAAFLRDFMKRGPKYEMVDPLDYLK